MSSLAGHEFNSRSIAICVKWPSCSHLVSLLLDMQHYYVYVDVCASSRLFSILLYHYIVHVLKVCPLYGMWHVPVTSPSPSVIPVSYLLLYFEFFKHGF